MSRIAELINRYHQYRLGNSRWVALKAAWFLTRAK